MCPAHDLIRDKKRQEKPQKQKTGEVVVDLNQEQLMSIFLENPADPPMVPPHAPPCPPLLLLHLLVHSPLWCSVAAQCPSAGAPHPCWCINWCLVQVRLQQGAARQVPCTLRCMQMFAGVMFWVGVQ